MSDMGCLLELLHSMGHLKGTVSICETRDIGTRLPARWSPADKGPLAMSRGGRLNRRAVLGSPKRIGAGHGVARQGPLHLDMEIPITSVSV
jgi:hypothetical protein